MLDPQHLRAPSSAVTYAQVWPLPSASSPTGPPTLIVVGVRRSVFVPSPSWKSLFQPQHLRAPAPAVTYAHVWLDPSVSSPTGPPTLIVVGVYRLSVPVPSVPSPSWPSTLVPQHLRAPSPAVTYAHVLASPSASRAEALNSCCSFRTASSVEGGCMSRAAPEDLKRADKVCKVGILCHFFSHRPSHFLSPSCMQSMHVSRSRCMVLWLTPRGQGSSI